MTRSAFDKTTSGESLVFFSKEHNAMIDAAEAHKNNLQNFNVPGKISNTRPGFVDVENISGQTVDQFNYMVVEDFIFPPQANVNFFANNAAFKVNIFNEQNAEEIDQDEGALVILLEPIKAEEVGLAMIVGSTQLRVNVTDSNHKYATLKSGSTILESAAGGPVKLVTKEQGIGEKWAYGIFPIEVIEQQFKVIGVNQLDSITCVKWDGTNEGTKQIEVAMPWEIRQTPFDGETWHDIDFVYQDFQHREATAGEDDPEKLVILPLYKADDIVIASRAIAGGIDAIDQATGKQLEWLDANKGGRYWATDDSEEEEEEE